MRRYVTFSLVALVILFFAACANLVSPSMGHLAVTVPPVFSGTTAKSLGTSARGLNFGPTDVPAIRIYVVLNGSFIPSAGKDYFQNDLSAASGSSSNTFSIDLVPSKGYQVFVAIGSTNGGWQTKYYGSTDSFTVSSGVYTNKDLSVVSTTLTATPSATPAFAAIVNNGLWEIVGGNVIPPSAPEIPVGNLAINSLSAGEWRNGSAVSPELWINTDSGIYAVSGGAIVSRVAQTYASGVKASVVFDASIGSDIDDLVIGYFGSDLGVAYSTSQTSVAVDSNWKTASLTDYLNSPDGSSFKNLITDPSRFVNATAFVPNGNSSYGYIATSLGSYYYNPSVQKLIGTDPIGWIKSQLTSDSQYALIAASGGKSAAITSLALDLPLDGTSVGPTTLYAGTGVGLFSTAVDSSGVPANKSLLSVPGASMAIQKVAAAYFGGSSYSAYVDGDGNLNVLKGGATTLSTYPFYAFTASRSGVTSLAFYSAGGALNLAVGCQDGLIVVPVVPAP